MTNRRRLVARSLSRGERSLPIVGDRCRSLTRGRDRWRFSEIVVCRRQKIDRQISRGAAGRFAANRPGRLVRKPPGRSGRQSGLTHLPANHSDPLASKMHPANLGADRKCLSSEANCFPVRLAARCGWQTPRRICRQARKPYYLPAGQSRLAANRPAAPRRKAPGTDNDQPTHDQRKTNDRSPPPESGWRYGQKNLPQVWKDLKAEPPRSALRATLRLSCLASAQHRARLQGQEPAAGNTAAEVRTDAAGAGAGAAHRSTGGSYNFASLGQNCCFMQVFGCCRAELTMQDCR